MEPVAGQFTYTQVLGLLSCRQEHCVDLISGVTVSVTLMMRYHAMQSGMQQQVMWWVAACNSAVREENAVVRHTAD